MKNIIVREYLESLTESAELDYIFPILLEVMGFHIVSTPKQTKGLAQYGKDVVAIGIDQDGRKKRFYFEIKGGADRHITATIYNKDDGIRESIREAKDRPYKDRSIPGFNNLPIKIVVVHNGTLHPSVKETFDGFIEREFPEKEDKMVRIIPGLIEYKKKVKNDLEFERWDIYKLTELFAEFLFNEYLLTDSEAVNNFKKVLVLTNTPRNNFSDFYHLIDSIFQKAGDGSTLGERKKFLFLETLRMVSFIVYHYSKDANNLNAAKKCIPYSLLRLWSWVLQNSLEGDPKVVEHFRKHFAVLHQTLSEYFEKTIPVAIKQNGLWSPNGGRYEQIGYPLRTMEYLSFLVFHFHCQASLNSDNADLLDQQLHTLIEILNKNDSTTRPFLDNHSIPIVLVLTFLIQHGRTEDAKSYLRNVIHSIRIGYYTHNRVPDGRSRVESVIQFAVRHTKSVYYEDKTSHLLGILLEFTAVMNMEPEYGLLKSFIKEAAIDTSLFIPYDDIQLTSSSHADTKHSHEVHLLKHELYSEGFQDEVRPEESFKEFQDKTLAKPVFSYEYKSVKAGFPYLIDLAHVYFRTPYFPDSWRNYRS